MTPLTFNMAPSVRAAAMHCERGSYEDFGEFHSDWDCTHPHRIYQRHPRKLVLNACEVECVLASLDNAADLCADHELPTLRRAAPKIARLADEIREAVAS